jgi:arginase
MAARDRTLHVEIIGFDSGWGCRDFRCEDGPAAVAADSMLLKLRDQGIGAKWHGPLGLKFLGNHAELTTKEKTLPLTVEAVRRLSNYVRNARLQGSIPVVIGGDHSSAIGTWAGVVEAAQAYGNFGLVWLDAHLDAHTYETSYQGKWGGWWHGQPVSALFGEGLLEFRSVGGLRPKLSPQHMSIIGAHSFEPAEAAFVQRLGIRVYYLDEVQKRGFAAVFDESLRRATTGTKGFGLTIDLDAFQPSDAPGVGASEDKGLVAAEVLPIIRTIGWDPRFMGLELAEFNPHQDIQNKTRQLIEKLVESVMTKPLLKIDE